MEYKRLTNELRSIIGEYKLTDNQWQAVEQAIRTFNKIEQGKLVELPCKVGDTVYRIWACGKNGHSIASFKVIGIHNRGEGWYIIYESKKNFHTAYFTGFGKSIFLTKEQAEARLKEVQNERYNDRNT